MAVANQQFFFKIEPQKMSSRYIQICKYFRKIFLLASLFQLAKQSLISSLLPSDMMIFVPQKLGLTHRDILNFLQLSHWHSFSLKT